MQILNHTATLPSMTFDFEIVREIHDQIERATGSAPKLYSYAQPPGYVGQISTEIPISDLDQMSKRKRRTLVLDAPGTVRVDFRAGELTSVHAPSEPELMSSIADRLVREGRRRVVWSRLLPALPIAGGAVATILTILALIFDGARPLTTLASAALLVMLWGGLAWATIRIRDRTQGMRQGARLRETSRSDFRDRVTNARAASVVALVFTPLGALVGWGLRTMLGG